MSTFEIPLISMPQRFAISLAGITYNMKLRWNAAGQFWDLDVSDINNAPVVLGVPLVTGVDFLEQLAYLGIGGQMTVTTDYDTNAPPTSSNLGSQSHLFFTT